MSKSDIPRWLRDEIFPRDLGCCRYCQLRQIGQGSIFHINHIIPRSAGGITAAALAMNDQLPRIARLLQIQVGILTID